MANINLFQIDENKEERFVKALQNELFVKIGDKNVDGFHFIFYTCVPSGYKDMSWKWVYDEFEQEVDEIVPAPKGVLLIRENVLRGKPKKSLYVVTFGSAFFLVDKYCNKSFGFECVKRMKFARLNLTAVNNYGTIRNRVIASYRETRDINPAAGESYSKIKARMQLPEGIDCIGTSVEAGSSIRFRTGESGLKALSDLVRYIGIVMSQKVCHRIPQFDDVKDKNERVALDAKLREAIEGNSSEILLSEFSVIGSEEVFNRADSYELLAMKRGKKEYDELSMKMVKEFCKEHEISSADEMLKIRVGFMRDGVRVNRKSLYELIDYLDDDTKSLLYQGDWKRFNEDYLSFLHNSLNDIKVEYNSEFDITGTVLKNFRTKQIEKAEKGELKALDDAERKEKIDNRYYLEYAYNTMRVDDGFALYDRKMRNVGQGKVELCDLMKGDAIFSVKIGNASSKLSYVVDQSLTIVELLRNGALPGVAKEKIEQIGLWIVLERATQLPFKNGHLEWEKLNMLILKVRIEEWKRAVREAGFKPIVYINYMKQD